MCSHYTACPLRKLNAATYITTQGEGVSKLHVNLLSNFLHAISRVTWFLVVMET